MISKNSFIGFGRRLVFYIKTIETIHIDTYLVYPCDLMIDDSENKDFTRIRFCESENKLFDARFMKMNKNITQELQKILYVNSFAKSLFYLTSFRSRDVFPKR